MAMLINHYFCEISLTADSRKGIILSPTPKENSMQRTPRSRKAAELPQPLHKKIDLYTLAAGAAGVGMLALAHPAQAKIVYTAKTLDMTVPNIYEVDLNNDGKPDMQFDFGTAATTGGGWAGITLSRASYSWALSNQVVAASLDNRFAALALPAGQGIGPNRKFEGGGLIGGRITDSFSHFLQWDGQWANGGKGLNNRYAGVKFMINGEVHYGWIRVSMDTTTDGTFNTTMTGYAYETIPNKPILAGATKESDEDQTSASLETLVPGPATLGALALGAPGLSIWRRND
jgi:hypothetical protein